jgi:hypothetical protein
VSRFANFPKYLTSFLPLRESVLGRGNAMNGHSLRAGQQSRGSTARPGNLRMPDSSQNSDLLMTEGSHKSGKQNTIVVAPELHRTRTENANGQRAKRLALTHIEA